MVSRSVFRRAGKAKAYFEAGSPGVEPEIQC